MNNIESPNSKYSFKHSDRDLFVQERKKITSQATPIELPIEKLSHLYKPDALAQLKLQYHFLIWINYFYIFRKDIKNPNNLWAALQVCRFEISDNWDLVDFHPDATETTIVESFHKLSKIDIFRVAKKKFEIRDYTDDDKLKARELMKIMTATQTVNQAVNKLTNMKNGIFRKYIDITKLTNIEIVEKWKYKVVILQDPVKYLVAENIIDGICVTIWNRDTKTSGLVYIDKKSDIDYLLNAVIEKVWNKSKIEVNLIWWRAFNPKNFEKNSELRKILFTPLAYVQKFFDELWVRIKEHDIVACQWKPSDIKNIALDKNTWEIFKTKNT